MFSVKNKNSRTLIGLDLGSHSLKAVLLNQHKKTPKSRDSAASIIAHEVILKNDVLTIADAMNALRTKIPLLDKNVAIALNGADVNTQIVTMDANFTAQQLAAQISIEAENSFPLALEELFLDFAVIGPHEKDRSLNDILLCVAHKKSVQDQVKCVEEAGFKVIAVDITSHCLYRAYRSIFKQQDNTQAIAIIDIGASQMSINIGHQDNIIFSCVKHHGGARCTKMLAEHYQIDEAAAEKIKIAGKWSKRCQDEVIAPFIEMTINYLRFDFRMFTNVPQNVKVEKIILTGGSSLLAGLATQLSTQLAIKVHMVASFHDNNEMVIEHLASSAHQYMLAFGLSLRRPS